MDDFDLFQPRKKKHGSLDVNVAPILDVMFTIIFFLLVATSFEAYTKLTVPPSRVSAAQSKPDDEPPANPRVVVQSSGANFQVTLKAAGKDPYLKNQDAKLETLRKTVGEVVKEYVKTHPGERTYQLTIEGDLSYEVLVFAMDGIREVSNDIVLVAPVDGLAGKSLGESVL